MVAWVKRPGLSFQRAAHDASTFVIRSLASLLPTKSSYPFSTSIIHAGRAQPF